MHYTGTLDDGTVFDSSEGRQPLEFTIGGSQVIPGFESGIREMSLNEEKTIQIKAKDAYGDRDEKMVVSVPRNKFPPEIVEGGHLLLKDPDGQRIPAKIQEIKEDEVIIDLNHPLAGKDLTFKVKVVAIN